LGTEDGRRSPTLSVSFVKTQARQGASLSDLRAIRAYQARNPAVMTTRVNGAGL